MNKHFQRVGSARPGRSMFNLSYEKKLTCDLGEIIPVLCDECIPGDLWTIGMQMVLRMTPLVAPILHQVDVYVHYFFVPYRICCTIDEGDYLNYIWEDFITGGVDGDDTQQLPVIASTLTKGGIGDYLGYPVGVAWPGASAPMGMPHDAYHLIWDEYYRDETLQEKSWHNTSTYPIDQILLRNWEKDYFTSASITQQRGTSPAIPITGTSSAVFDNTNIIPNIGVGNTSNLVGQTTLTTKIGTTTNSAADQNAATNLQNVLADNIVDLDSASPIDINDMREAFQIQRFLERNMRAGVRYKEFLQSHFSVTVDDDRLQRPEYIGGCKCPVIVSEVLQTSKTDGTAYQGTMTGHGIAVNQEYIAKYHVKEFGLIMGLLSVMPKPAYQQGINRQWLRKTRYDFYFPEFSHLSEQAITQNEIYTTAAEADNNKIFGFCGAYDEMRVKQNMVCGNFRDTYDYWHMGRQFGNAPELNSSFIQCVPRKDCFAVQNEDCLLIQFGNLITALRPMPIIAEPGLIDHG